MLNLFSSSWREGTRWGVDLVRRQKFVFSKVSENRQKTKNIAKSDRPKTRRRKYKRPKKGGVCWRILRLFWLSGHDLADHLVRILPITDVGVEHRDGKIDVLRRLKKQAVEREQVAIEDLV
jgi:hypothetical protein